MQKNISRDSLLLFLPVAALATLAVYFTRRAKPPAPIHYTPARQLYIGSYRSNDAATRAVFKALLSELQHHPLASQIKLTWQDPYEKQAGHRLAVLTYDGHRHSLFCVYRFPLPDAEGGIARQYINCQNAQPYTIQIASRQPFPVKVLERKCNCQLYIGVPTA